MLNAHLLMHNIKVIVGIVEPLLWLRGFILGQFKRKGNWRRRTASGN